MITALHLDYYVSYAYAMCYARPHKSIFILLLRRAGLVFTLKLCSSNVVFRGQFVGEIVRVIAVLEKHTCVHTNDMQTVHLQGKWGRHVSV